MLVNESKLEEKITQLLGNFYSKRMVMLDKLQLKKALQRKNPYLFRAIGVEDANQIVEDLLKAFVSSSDETLFGNEFFEPLVKWVAQQTFHENGYNVTTSDGEGVDITIQSSTFIRPIAVKSGVNVFNAASKKKQGENFSTLRRRLQKVAVQFDPVVGYCYGRKKQSFKTSVNFQELAGQDFWLSVSHEQDFYLRIVHAMRERPAAHRILFQDSFDKAKNRFSKEFLSDFSNEDGAIDWDKLVKFNSGRDGLSTKGKLNKRSIAS
jgi:Type II restriction endonuclease EcoO109I